jgi:hypothetical protein
MSTILRHCQFDIKFSYMSKILPNYRDVCITNIFYRIIHVYKLGKN